MSSLLRMCFLLHGEGSAHWCIYYCCYNTTDLLDFIPLGNVRFFALVAILWDPSLAIKQTICLILPYTVMCTLRWYTKKLCNTFQFLLFLFQLTCKYSYYEACLYRKFTFSLFAYSDSLLFCATSILFK